LDEEPVVILTGPRTVGKSTLLAALAARFDRPVLDLDRPDARAAAAQHGHQARTLRPHRIHEVPGPAAGGAVADRAGAHHQRPAAVPGELRGRRENFLDRLWADPARLPAVPSRPVTRDEYVDRILSGGFPMILQRLTPRARTSWFADYVDLVVMRDVLDIARAPAPPRRGPRPGPAARSRR
jgi:predicted AAA+ superfamily ATPase